MAKIEIITLTDSLDERISAGVETVVFHHPVYGTKHEIELSEKNREHFANHLAKLDKYFDASRIVEDAKPEPKATAAKSDLSKVREWAKANGYEVGDRGRIKAEILKAYNTALVLGEPEKELDEDSDSVNLESAIKHAGEGNVEDLGDFTQYVEQDSESVAVNPNDPTENMTSDEFAAFLADNIGSDGTVDAGKVVSQA
jgi:hypothetical protein